MHAVDDTFLMIRELIPFQTASDKERLRRTDAPGGRRKVMAESPGGPSTAGEQLGCQLAAMISKLATDVRTEGPPAVTKSEKSSSLVSTAS